MTIAMPDPLNGRVVLIAGAGSGIGRATAIAAAAAGAYVILAARNVAALEAVAAQISQAGGTALVAPCDLADHDEAQRLVATTLDAYGRLDMLVNSVGVNIPRRAIDELTVASWRLLIESNLTAAFNLTQAALPPMRRQRDGLIVHVSSISAKRGDRSGIAYQASKAGVEALARGTMEEERANGIRVSVIFPGMVDTPLLQRRPVPPPPEVLAQVLQPDDVAAACLFVMRLPARAHVSEVIMAPATVS